MEAGEYGKVPGMGRQAGQFGRLAPTVVREAFRPRALPLALLLLTIAGGAWAQDGSPRVAWETFATNGVVLAFVLLALRFLHKGLTELRAELRTVATTLKSHGERLGRLEAAVVAQAADLRDLRAELGTVKETLSAHGERLGRIEAAQEAFAAELSDLRAETASLRTELGARIDGVHTELGTVKETLSGHGERLGRIEAAQEATVTELSDLRTTMHGVRDTVHTSAERLAWIEGAIDRRLKPANSDAAAARSADPVPAA